jgi:hypothetical protein
VPPPPLPPALRGMIRDMKRPATLRVAILRESNLCGCRPPPDYVKLDWCIKDHGMRSPAVREIRTAAMVREHCDFPRGRATSHGTGAGGDNGIAKM